MQIIKWILIFLGVLMMVGVIQLGYEISYRMIFGKASYATEAVFRVPRTNIEIILERRAIHLFLAEYERTLVLRVDEKEVLRKEVAADSGGYSRMNVYQISPAEYFLIGDMEFDRHVLDITRQKLNSIISAEKPSSAKFVGAFDIDEKRSWHFITVTEREEQKSKFEQ